MSVETTTRSNLNLPGKEIERKEGDVHVVEVEYENLF